MREWRLEADGYTAVVTAVGASLRELRYGGRDLVVPFDAEEVRPVYRGATLAPWPNRVIDGTYVLRGRRHQLAINEVEHGHALHGLVHWVRWELAATDGRSLVLEHELVAQDGYPWPLHLRVELMLSRSGLTTTLVATNRTQEPVPYGCCSHPYLTPGSGRLDEWIMTVPARSRLEVDQCMAPTTLAAVDAVDCDYRQPARIGERKIDHAFTDLTRDPDGSAAVRVVDAATGQGTELRWGRWADWVQVHTADRPEPELDRAGLAVEPMSCPPGAYNAADGPPLLAPGSSHVARWTISAVIPPAPADGGTRPPPAAPPARVGS